MLSFTSQASQLNHSLSAKLVLISSAVSVSGAHPAKIHPVQFPDSNFNIDDIIEQDPNLELPDLRRAYFLASMMFVVPLLGALAYARGNMIAVGT